MAAPLFADLRRVENVVATRPPVHLDHILEPLCAACMWRELLCARGQPSYTMLA
ncbi:MAG: hypothetical protein H7Z42_20505 [Roseiflexaceae bacterium]|nr:hypothetical protein [Roseiflexaceae bacterium]